MSNQLDRTLALAGMFQSAAIVQQVARTGSLPETAFEASIRSVFVLDPENTLAVYGSARQLSLGMDALDALLRKQEATRYAEAFRYTVGLVQLEKQLGKKPDMLSILRSRLEQAQNQLNFFDNEYSHPTLISNLARLYVDSLGSFDFRIQVKGDPQFLKQDEIASQIRASLLAGVRSAMLWRQLGGSRLQFLFGKAKILASLSQLQQQARLD